MTAFGWRAPWPRRFGGGSEQPTQVMLETMRAGRPDMLTAQGDSSEADLENKVAARMLVAGLRATARRVAQRDPRKLSDIARLVTLPDGTQRTLSPLERWERILGLVPARGASPRARRAAVYGALVAASSTRRSSVESAMSGVFGAWYFGLQEPDLSDVHYPGKLWLSTLAFSWAAWLIFYTMVWISQSSMCHRLATCRMCLRYHISPVF
jgi:hypothetical protein